MAYAEQVFTFSLKNKYVDYVSYGAARISGFKKITLIKQVVSKNFSNYRYLES
jgi:hypothetical protein